MNCREFERRLESSAPVDAEAARHLESCASCRDLEELARASTGEPSPPDVELTAAVMARTGGTACGAACDRLAEFADGALEGLVRDLVVSHVDTCASCGELARAIQWISRELPALAAIDPGEQFTAAVLRATRPTASAPIGLAIPFLTGPARWWAALRDRPRFTWEAAYAGALILWLLFGAGFAPFGQVPGRALDLARSNPVRALAGSVQPASLGRQAWEATGGRVMEKAQVSAGAVIELGGLGEVREASSSLARHGSEALGSALRGDLSASAVRLKDMGGDLKRIYGALRRRGTDPNRRSKEA